MVILKVIIRKTTKKRRKAVEREQAFVDGIKANITAIQQDIQNLRAQENSDGALIAGESGVSFGIPIVANIAAKMKLINPDLTGPQIHEILMATVSSNPNIDGLSESGGMVDPAAAYAVAFNLKQ